ncbi:MAG TPA: FtsK/SpoIIIE domain-containing protein [Tepidisphaeraceae bacterium]|nr:FtsK/SpoIIIE domain-containing protein [Tepidisphaeraceae bacterium]
MPDPLDESLVTLDRLPPTAAPAAASAGAAPPATAETDRDIQRSALRDLIALSTESASTEADIEREHRTSLEKEKQTFSDRDFQINEQHKQHVADANQQNQDRLNELASQYQAERNKIVSADKAFRQKIESEKSAIDDRLKQKYDQAVWEADSVNEMASQKIAADYKATTEAIKAAGDALNAMEVKAAELVQLYGLPLATDAVNVDDDPQITTSTEVAFARHKEAIEQHLSRLGHMPLASLFIGIRPYLFLLLITAAAAAAVQFHAQSTDPQWKALAIFAGGTFVLALAIGFALRLLANSKVRAVYHPLRQELVLARSAAEQQQANAVEKRKADTAAATKARQDEVQAAKEEVGPQAAKAARNRDAATATAQAEFAKQVARIDRIRDTANAETAERLRRMIHEIDHKQERELRDNKTRNQTRLVEIEQRYQQRRAELEQHWSERLRRIQAPIDRDGDSVPASLDWNDGAWKSWTPPKKFASRVRFGEMQVDLKQIAENVPQRLTLPPTFSLPALLAFPAQASLLIHTDHAGRGEAIRTLQMLMARLLTNLPPGRVRFTILDPVGLGQNFAGFMHLSDYDDALVGGRIWTSQDQIDQRLANLTDHMETVIQKYLRNEFQTIDEYNAQAGELAEPYRFLVIADLPVGFTSEAFRRLNSIASTGARCGVYTLIARDTRAALPAGAHLDELVAHSVNLVREGDRFVWDDDVFRPLPLTLDPPPREDVLLTEILHKVGAGAKEAKRVEVPFENIAPSNEAIWSRSTTSEIDVPIGRLGANRLQSLKLGRGVAQHVLIAGKTGSGKSTLLHAMITNAAMWYSPDEVELYLIDFKKGVEFKTYASNLLPHARAIAVESDREFGLSVLQRLDAELSRRGELFRKAAVQDLAAYSKTPNAVVIPRTLLMIDEFQEFFSEDDKLAQESALLIDRLVRQGRAFGIHVLLGSQTIGGAGGLPRSTLGQMAVRIALQTSEADSQLILGDNNSAARLLSRPGEAIYNDAGGLVEGNSPFQVAWLPDDKRDKYLRDLARRAKPYFERFGYPIVFEGNAPADIRRNPQLTAAMEAKSWSRVAAARAWLGEPVAIKEPTAVTFRRQAGANMIMVGQQDEQSMALACSSIVSLAAQQGSDQAVFYILDGTPADSALAGTFARVGAALPHDVKLVEWRATPEAIDEIAKEVTRRQDVDQPGAPSIYVIVYGLQRYRALRKQEDDFGSFSMDADEPKKANPGKQFAEILRDGPPVGVHVITWADTLVAVDRTLDRGSMREFDNRVLFQMSAADSSNLIDSPVGNKLGFNRALVYSEEQGVMERFRPYALPDGAWLATVSSLLNARNTQPA